MNNVLSLNLPASVKIKNSFFTKRFFLRCLLFFGIISIGVLLMFYVFQVNSQVSERYQIRKYEKKIDKILGENKMLEISAAQTNSLDRIASLVGDKNFEKIDKIDYVKILNGQVVKK